MDNENLESPGFLNALTRMGERVAALEARTGAEIGALKKDTEAIRAASHEQAGTMTRFISIMATTQESLRGHLADCAKRGARLEKIGYLVLVLVIGTLGFLLKVHFFPGAA